MILAMHRWWRPVRTELEQEEAAMVQHKGQR